MTLRAVSSITTRVATPADAALLASLAETSFVDTFAAQNTAEDMALYVAGAFGEQRQRAELSDARYTVFIAEREGEAVGYAMLRAGPAPDVVGGDAIEIARLYSATHVIGSGVGATLMQCCLSAAASRSVRTVWLAVWERNARAIAFYARWGFVDVGEVTFKLGRDVQTDRVMLRRVAEGG